MNLKEVREELLRKDPHCWYCGRGLSLGGSTLDHLRPRALGGNNCRRNLRLACRRCNNRKANIPVEYIVVRLPRGRGLLRIWEFHEREKRKGKRAMTRNNNVAGFNYKALEKKHRETTKKHAESIRGMLERNAENVVSIGRHLWAVHDLLGPEPFQAWIQAEFRWSQSVASNYMRVAKRFGDLECLKQFQPSALYALARRDVEPKTVKKAIKAAEAGELITAKRAKQMIAEAAAKPKGNGKAGRDVEAGPNGQGGRNGNDPKAQEASAPKPDSLYRLRSSIRMLSSNVETLLRSVSAEEAGQLAEELLDLAMQLRTASRSDSKPAKKNAKGKGRGKRRKAAA